MQTHFVRVECDVTAKVHSNPFRYRAYVGNELFTERTWIWDNCYLEEIFQIKAAPGVYPIRFETVDDSNGRLKIRNFRIVSGPGKIIYYRGEPSLEISDAHT